MITKFPFSAVLWPFRTGLFHPVVALAKEEIAMRIRSAGLAALVAAAGFWMSFSGAPAMAAKSTAQTAKAAKANAADRPVVLAKFKKQRVAKKSKPAKHAKKTGSKVASKAARATQTSDDKSARSEAKVAESQSKTDLPASVANARAQALAADEARNIAALDSTDVVDGMKLASADQVPGSDTAPDTSTAASPEAAAPAAVAPPVSAPGKILRPVSSGDRPVAKPADDSDPWSKTSLIGKIFIAFGSLLTLASAARLLIA